MINHRQNLLAIYSTIPGIRCRLCGECCYTVPVFFSEYIHIVDFIYKDLPDGLRQQVLYKIQNFNSRWDSAQRHFRCAFYGDESGVCQIYDARPFVCRLYGHKIDGLPAGECAESQNELLSSGIADHGFSNLAGLSKPFNEPFPFEFWFNLSSAGIARTTEMFRNDPRFIKVMVAAEMLSNRLVAQKSKSYPLSGSAGQNIDNFTYPLV